MRKRQKFVLTAILLAMGLVVVHRMPIETRYWMIGVLSMVTWVLAAWSLREGLNGVEWLTVVLPPVTFTVAVGLFYILLPKYLIIKIGLIVVFGLAQYFILLTANIYSVAAIRTIALLRAAHVMGFVMSLLCSFLLFNTILSLRLGWWWVGPMITGSAWLVYLPSIWSIKLEEKISKQVWVYTFWLGLALGMVAIAITIWPMNLSVAALFLTTYMYVTLGIVGHYLQDRLTSKMTWEYVVWGLVVMVTALVKTWF